MMSYCATDPVHQLTVLVEVLVAIEMDVQIKEQRDRLQ
jgi:hypothetical protein